MKKRLLSVLLVLALVFSLMPGFAVTASAEDNVTLLVNSSVSDDNAARAAGAAYKTVAGAIGKAQNGDTIQLASDITECVTVGKGKTVTLDLNGYVLKGTGSDRVITNNGTLTITDSNSAATHKYVVGADGLWTWNDSAEGTAIAFEELTALPTEGSIITVKGGAITGGNTTGRGGGIGNYSELTLNGGSIIGNCVSKSESGGGIYNHSDCTLTLTNTFVLGNTAAISGGGIQNFGTLTATGSAFCYNKAASGYGGGVGNNGIQKEQSGNGTGTLENCTITGNSATYGGGVHNGYQTILKGATVISGNTASLYGGGISGYGYWGYQHAGQITIDGTGVVVKDNTCTAKAELNNLALELGYQLKLENAAGVTGNNIHIALFEGSVSGAAMPTAGNPAAITGDNGANDCSGYFTSDQASYAVIHKDGSEQLSVAAASVTKGAPAATVYYDTVQEAIDAAVPADKDTVRLLRNVTENVTVASDDNITLDLNGYVLQAAAVGSVITNEGTLTITDSAETKTTRYFTDSNSDGCFEKLEASYDTTGKTEGVHYIKVTGGVITGGLDIWGGGVNNKGTFTFTSGNIVGCKAAAIGGGSGSQQGGGQQQGTGESTFRGGAVYNSGTYNMTGGQISGCTSAEEGGAIFNEGAATLPTGLISFCSAQNGGAIYNKSTQTNLTVGLNISNCTANGTADGTGYGGAIYNAASTNLLLSGSISNCSAAVFGGGVFNKGAFTMNTGAVIKECSAVKGAGVHNDGSTGVAFTMTGGEIKNNTAKRTDGGKSTGGGVQVSAGSTFIMTGGSITGNKTNAATQYGAGVYNKGTMTVGGTATITGNTHGNSAAVSNLCLAGGKTVSVSSTTPLTTGASVGVSAEEAPTAESPVAVTGVNGADYSGCFTSDSADYYIKNVGNTVQLLGAVTAKFPLKVKLTTDSENTRSAIDLDFTLQALTAGAPMPTNPQSTLTFVKNSAPAAEAGFYGEYLTQSPWEITFTKSGTYEYKVMQRDGNKPAPLTLDSGVIFITAEVDMSKGTVKVTTAKGVTDLGDDTSFRAFISSGVASYSAAEQTLYLGGKDQKVVSYDAFNRAAVKSAFPISFTKDFSMSGTMSVGNAADGTVIGFVPNGVALNPTSDFSTAGSALGVYSTPKNGNGIFLEFDTLEDQGSWGSSTYNAHFALTQTDASGYPSGVSGQLKEFSGNYALPSGTMNYTVQFTAATKMLVFTVMDGSNIYTFSYQNPVGVFKNNEAYLILGGAMRYGSNNIFGCGSTGSPAPKTEIHIDKFLYTDSASEGADCFLNRYSRTVINPTVSMSGYTYGDASVPTPVVTTPAGSGTVTCYYSTTNSTTGGTEWKNMTGTTLDAGTYYMYAVVDGNDEYRDGVTPAVLFTVAKKQLGVAGTMVSNKEYDGTAVGVISKAGTPQDIVTGEQVTLSAAAVFDDQTVAEDKTVTVTYTLSGTDAGNYLAPDDETFTAAILRKTLTVSGTAVTGKTYDGTTDAALTQGTVTGIAEGEDVTVTASASFEDKNAGTDKTVSVLYTLSGADTGNYIAPAPENITASITKKPLTAKWTETVKEYNGAAQKPTAELSGVCSGDTVSVDASGILRTDAGSYLLTAVLTGADSANYVLDDPYVNFIIQKAPVSFTVTNDSRSYDGNAKYADIAAEPAVGFTAVYRSSRGESVAQPKACGDYGIYVTLDDNHRFADAADGSARRIGTLTIYGGSAPETYSVSFSGGEGALGSTEALAAVKAGVPQTLPACGFTKAGWAFAGWRCGDSLYRAGESFTQPAEETVMTAEWTQKVYSIGGIVKSSSGAPQENAVVTLMSGARMIGEQQVTGADGAFGFTGVISGLYNLVTSYNGVIVTTVLELAADSTGLEIRLPAGRTNSVIEVSAGSPEVIVDGLDESFTVTASGNYRAEDQDIVDDGGSVEFKLTVSENAAPSEAKQEELAEKSPNAFLYLDIGLSKTTIENDSTTTVDTLYTTDALITIVIPIPAELQGKDRYHVYRYHTPDGNAANETLTELNELPAYGEPTEEGYRVSADRKTITVYARSFSLYAISYTEESAVYTGIAAGTPAAVTTTAAAHGNVSMNKASAIAGATVTLTVKPEKGWTLETLTVTDANGRTLTLKAVKPGEIYTFTMPGSAVSVEASFMEDNAMLSFFTDVSAGDYYYDAVLWAAEKGITSGVDAAHFAPMDITTRGQMVTFLWRASGSPEPSVTTTAFTDLKADAYYYKAVLWATGAGIAKGISATEFAPDVTVTRGQCVAFLARYAGVMDEDAGYTHGFTDVRAADYYNNAVAWAASKGITNGVTATSFAPNQNCLRGQIVTFIYRNFVS